MASNQQPYEMEDIDFMYLLWELSTPEETPDDGGWGGQAAPEPPPQSGLLQHPGELILQER